jgi:ParB family transcriptional regulator, chromosome partitioning protein
MTTKRRMFGISASLSKGISETISIVENSDGIFRNTVIPMSRVEADPENPRRLLIRQEELLTGPDKNDQQFTIKQAEYEKLKELAHTIKNKGLMQPIVVYKLDDKYRVVAGNRRFFASIIAGKSEIEARVFNHKPNKMDLKLVQWIENTARDDLSLADRLGNIESIISEYQKINKDAKITANLLSDIVGVSLTQSKYYLSVLRSSYEDLRRLIDKGHIPSLDKANLIASVNVPELREKIIAACTEGASLKELRKMADDGEKILRESSRAKHSMKKAGRAASKVNLGATANINVVRRIILSILEKPEYSALSKHFTDIDWSNFNQISTAFRTLITMLERIHRE